MPVDRIVAVRTARKTWLLPLCLAACVSVPPFDPEVAAGAASIETEAASFFSGLRGKSAPGCAFDANAAAYQSLGGKAATLSQRVAGGSDETLQRSIAALGNVISGAERSHQLASATTTDPSGACIAPDALDLNASAIARAAGAIRELESARGGR